MQLDPRPFASTDEFRTLGRLREATTALYRLSHGQKQTWVEWDVLRSSVDYLRARGIDPLSDDREAA